MSTIQEDIQQRAEAAAEKIGKAGPSFAHAKTVIANAQTAQHDASEATPD